jgi:hypothetical protein
MIDSLPCFEFLKVISLIEMFGLLICQKPHFDFDHLEFLDYVISLEACELDLPGRAVMHVSNISFNFCSLCLRQLGLIDSLF